MRSTSMRSAFVVMAASVTVFVGPGSQPIFDVAFAAGGDGIGATSRGFWEKKKHAFRVTTVVCASFS